MEQLGLTIAECGPFWKDPIHMRSNCVRALRLALRQWSHEVKREHSRALPRIDLTSENTIFSHTDQRAFSNAIQFVCSLQA